ncbi:uncharacterized protein [Lolium perenne]|uniref:uncharacterized protein n=1 Tax=Lolium perenne TaxID=4522 RepID=UPI003A9983DA
MGETRVPGLKKKEAWQGKAPHASMKRVKVYRLGDNGKWEDHGTGHVNIGFIVGSSNVALAVSDEEYNDTILLHKITPDDIYKKQESIISWKDPE